MILVTLVIGALVLFLSYVYIKQPVIRISASLLSLLVLAGSLVFLTLNQHEHYGMQQKATVKTSTIYPASSKNGMNLMLYKQIGTNGKETVQVYKNDPKQKKPSHTQVNEYTASNNHLKRINGQTASLKVKETRWVFDSSTAKFWFGVSGLENKLVKRTNTFSIPKSWLYLSADQVKTLQKQMAALKTKAGQAKLKVQAQKYVQNKIKAAAIKNPALLMDKTKQAKLVKKYGQEFKTKFLKHILEKK